MRSYSLKAGYSIFYSDVYFTEQIYVISLGFTRQIPIFVIAKVPDEVDMLVRDSYEGKDVFIDRVGQAQLALNQNIKAYVSPEKFPGFVNGCDYEVFETSAFCDQDAKSLVEKAHNFSKKTNVSMEEVVELATEFRRLWGSLGYWSEVAQLWQQQGLGTLDKIIREEVSQSQAQEYIYGLTGAFNQTIRDCVNFR